MIQAGRLGQFPKHCRIYQYMGTTVEEAVAKAENSGRVYHSYFVQEFRSVKKHVYILCAFIEKEPDHDKGIS